MTDTKNPAPQPSAVGTPSPLSDKDGGGIPIANCCQCGRIIDTREKSQGGDDFGAELSDGRWTCSFECWEAVVEPGFAFGGFPLAALQEKEAGE